MDAIITPYNRRQLNTIINTVTAYSDIERPVRRLLFKTGLAFNRIQFDLATAKKQIRSYERQIQDLRLKTKKKATVNPNKKFTNIAAIKEAQNPVVASVPQPPQPPTIVQPQIEPHTVQQDASNEFLAIAQQLIAISQAKIGI